MSRIAVDMPKSRIVLQGILFSAGAGLLFAAILGDMAWGMILGLGFGLADLFISN
jgi:hypothetical protein